MLVAHFLDLIPIWWLAIVTVGVMLLFIELGFRFGIKARSGAMKAQTSQVRAIMGAGLGLLAFMLAFTFNTAQTHFEARVQNLAEEARIARNAYFQADMLQEPTGQEAKQLLRNYIKLRANTGVSVGHAVTKQVADLLTRSEKIQSDLWALAVYAGSGDDGIGQSENNTQFKASILALTDIHFSRLHAAIMNRIPLTIWITLYLMAVLSMIIMGYQAGLTGKRSPVATVTLALAFSSVIILISDLDRPVMSFFEINNQLLVDLYEFMDADLRPEYYPGD